VIIRGPDREVVRELPASGDAGINRVVWDLRAAAPDGVPNTRGPFVPPGKYTMHLSAAGAAIPGTIQVDWDPAFPLTDEERRLRFTFLKEAGELQRKVHRISTALAAVKGELTKREDLKGVAAAASLLGKVEQQQQRIAGGGAGGEEGGFGGGLRSQVNGLINEIDGGGVQQGTLSGPTSVQRARLVSASAEVAKLVTDADIVLSDDLERLNTELDRLKLPRIVVPAAGTSSSSP
jgi:hypothetical protein